MIDVSTNHLAKGILLLNGGDLVRESNQNIPRMAGLEIFELFIFFTDQWMFCVNCLVFFVGNRDFSKKTGCNKNVSCSSHGPGAEIGPGWL